MTDADWKPTHRHRKRGTDYQVVGQAELQLAEKSTPAEGDLLTVYIGEDGKLWARLKSEFEDGRFEPLPDPGDHMVTLRVMVDGAIEDLRVPASLVNLAERRAIAKDDAREWTARDLAERLLRRIDAGEINPARIIVHYLEGDEATGFRHFHMCAGVTIDSHLSLLAMATHVTVEEWKE